MPTVNETISKVTEFTELPAGWWFGEGVPATNWSVNRAKAFLETARGLGIERANAFPGASGQVQVTFYVGVRMLELTIETDNTITLAEDFDNSQLGFIEGASANRAYAKLREFAEWASLDLFTENITTQSVGDSQAKHLISLASNLFRLWIETVRLKKAEQSVRTLPGITENRPERPPSTGISWTNIFRKTASTSGNEPSLVTIATATSIGA